MGKILCIGSMMVDIVCSLPRLPRSGEGIVSESVRMSLGGCAFNTAYAVRQSGAECALFAPVGIGPYANFVRAELARLGMADAAELGGLLDGAFGVGAADSGAAVCLVEPNGERTMVTLPGIERLYEPSWFGCINPAEFAVAEVCGYEIDGAGGDAIIGFLEANPHLEVVFAPGPVVAVLDPAKIARMNALHPVWHLNDAEVLAFTGEPTLREAGGALCEMCGNVVVVTAGAKGAWVFEPGCEPELVETEAVEAIDTIGAGDAHVGAVMAKRAQGRSWRDAVAFANRVSGVVCQTAGAIVPPELFPR